MIQRVVRIGIWSIVAVFLVALALRDLQLDRRLDVVARLDRATPYVSTLGPPVRVALSADRANIIGEPVYVNLRIPRWFRRATVELRYENPGNLPLRFGVRTHPTQWAFQFPTPSPDARAGAGRSLPGPRPQAGGSPERGGGPLVLRVPFDLQRAWQVERNVYRFVLSAPGVSAEQPIIVHGLRVTAERDPVCVGRFCL